MKLKNMALLFLFLTLAMNYSTNEGNLNELMVTKQGGSLKGSVYINGGQGYGPNHWAGKVEISKPVSRSWVEFIGFQGDSSISESFTKSSGSSPDKEFSTVWVLDEGDLFFPLNTKRRFKLRMWDISLFPKKVRFKLEGVGSGALTGKDGSASEGNIWVIPSDTTLELTGSSMSRRGNDTKLVVELLDGQIATKIGEFLLTIGKIVLSSISMGGTGNIPLIKKESTNWLDNSYSDCQNYTGGDCSIIGNEIWKDEDLDGNPEVNEPVAYIKNSGPEISTKIMVLPADGRYSFRLALSSQSADNEVPLFYSAENLQLHNGSNIVKLTHRKGSLWNSVQNKDLGFFWRYRMSGMLLEQGEFLRYSLHKFFILYNHPIRNDFGLVTAKRVDFITSCRNVEGKNEESLIAEEIGPDATAGFRYDNRNHLAETPWAILDGNSASCISLASLMKAELEMLGISGARRMVVTARHSDWALLSQDYDMYNLELEKNENNKDLIMYIPTFEMAPVNYFEACCLFKGKWWMGGTGRYANSDKEVLAEMTCPNDSAQDGNQNVSRQAWYDELYKAVSYPEPICEANGK